MKFEKIDVTKANVNPFQRIGQDWMLISAKKEGKVNINRGCARCGT